MTASSSSSISSSSSSLTNAVSHFATSSSLSSSSTSSTMPSTEATPSSQSDSVSETIQQLNTNRKKHLDPFKRAEAEYNAARDQANEAKRKFKEKTHEIERLENRAQATVERAEKTRKRWQEATERWHEAKKENEQAQADLESGRKEYERAKHEQEEWNRHKDETEDQMLRYKKELENFDVQMRAAILRVTEEGPLPPSASTSSSTTRRSSSKREREISNDDALPNKVIRTSDVKEWEKGKDKDEIAFACLKTDMWVLDDQGERRIICALDKNTSRCRISTGTKEECWIKASEVIFIPEVGQIVLVKDPTLPEGKLRYCWAKIIAVDVKRRGIVVEWTQFANKGQNRTQLLCLGRITVLPIGPGLHGKGYTVRDRLHYIQTTDNDGNKGTFYYLDYKAR